MNKTKILISLSGGIDSSMSLFILKTNDFYIEAIFMKNWNDSGHITYKDFKNALLICNKFKIKLNIIDLSNYYWKNVFLIFLKKLKLGFTPNPDIDCNKKIKFKILLQYCLFKLHFKFLSTGHYSKIFNINNKYYIQNSFDSFKDQSYFLSNIKTHILKYIIFTLSNYSKYYIKTIIKMLYTFNYNKKESMGICFIGNTHFKNFIQKYIKNKTGKIIIIHNNTIIGTHNGLHFYTLGEKLYNNNKNFFIIKKDITSNNLYVSKNNISCLMRNKITITFNTCFNFQKTTTCFFKIRHQSKLQKCLLIIKKKHYLLFLYKKNMLIPGQSLVFYKYKFYLNYFLIK